MTPRGSNTHRHSNTMANLARTQHYTHNALFLCASHHGECFTKHHVHMVAHITTAAPYFFLFCSWRGNKQGSAYIIECCLARTKHETSWLLASQHAGCHADTVSEHYPVSWLPLWRQLGTAGVKCKCFDAEKALKISKVTSYGR